MNKTTFAFVSALLAGSAIAQVNPGAGVQAGTGAIVTLPAPATDKATATTGVGTGAIVTLPVPAAENGAVTEAGVKAEAGAKAQAGKGKSKKSTTELGAGAAAQTSGNMSTK